MPTRRAVLFDLDGTLIDSKVQHISSWKELFERHGYPVSEADVVRSFGQTSRHIVRSMLAGQCDETQVTAMADEKEAIYRELIRDELELLPGAPELLDALRKADYRIALATSAPPENVSMVLHELRIGPLFDEVVGEQDISRSKPDPEIFLLAAERLNVAPCRCVVFEDSPSGVKAAIAAEMHCVAVTTGYSRHDLPGADLWIDDFRSIDVATITALTDTP